MGRILRGEGSEEFPSSRLKIFTCLLLLVCLRSQAMDLSEHDQNHFDLWMGTEGAQEEIIGGVVPADPGKWQSIYISRKDNAWCTAFAVGPQVLMTAAHCVSKSREILIKRPGEDDLKAQCKVPLSFPADVTADYALCKLNKDISSGPFETLNRDATRLKEETKILLTGYGCSSFQNYTDHNFAMGWVSFYSRAGGNYAVVGGDASVCFGDSGGPAFVVSLQDLNNRILVGINSQAWDDGATSLLSVVPTDIEGFFQRASDDGWVICGITSGARNCRHE